MLTEIDRKLTFVYDKLVEIDNEQKEAEAAKVGNLAALKSYIDQEGRCTKELSATSTFHQSLGEFLAKTGFLSPKQLAAFPLLQKAPTRPQLTSESYTTPPIQGPEVTYDADEIPF